MRFIIATVVGVLATATFLLSYQQKKRRNIIIWNTISRCLYVLQYLLLGAYSGAILDVLGAIVSVVAEKKDHPRIAKHIRPIVILCNLAIVVAGLLLCRSPIDLLPIAGVLLHTGAFWLRDERIIRRVSLCGSPFWFVYNLVSRAYGSAVGDLLTMVSILIAMVKYRKKKETQEGHEGA